jgi:hypothetical protein
VAGYATGTVGRAGWTLRQTTGNAVGVPAGRQGMRRQIGLETNEGLSASSRLRPNHARLAALKRWPTAHLISGSDAPSISSAMRSHRGDQLPKILSDLQGSNICFEPSGTRRCSTIISGWLLVCRFRWSAGSVVLWLLIVA